MSPEETEGISEAGIESEGSLDEQVVNYYFPVEIEVLGDLSEAQIQILANHVYEALLIELKSRL